MESLNTLIEYGDPAMISKNLRKVLFDYLEDELKIGPTMYFLDLLPQLNYLFNLLEEAAEAKGHPIFAVTKKHAAVENESCAPWLFEDDLLYRVTVFLVTTIEPERIYRIVHEPASQQQQVTDLLIVLPDTMQQKPFSAYETLIEAGCSIGTNLSFSLHQASQINTWVKEGHVLYSFVCTTENLMYWSEEKEWPVTPAQRKNEIQQIAWEKFQTGFSKAESFLKHATQAMAEQNNKLTAFFLQQAAELCCRTVISSLMGLEKKTHSIPLLKKYCQRCLPQVNESFPGNTENEKRLLKLLDDAYLSARYDDDFSPPQNDLDSLLREVTQLHNTVLSAVKHRLQLPS